MSTGRTVTQGLLMIISGIAILTIQTLVLGSMLDIFIYNLIGLDFELRPEFQTSLATALKFGDFFYFIPLIFAILLIVWGFKLIFIRHPYTYEEGEMYGW